jgi:hypothetical protein
MAAMQQRNHLTFLLCAVVVIAVASPTAYAHHSGAAYDTSKEVTIEGDVVNFEWVNPHAYIFVVQITKDGGHVEWKIEAVGLGVLRRLGWSGDTLAAGDKVTVTGNPDRNGAIKSLNLISLRKGDKTLFDAKGLMSVLVSAGDAPKAAATGLDGTWATLLAMQVVMRLQVSPKGAIALTPAGEAALAAYNERTMSPGLACIPQPAPFFMYVPDLKRVTTDNSVIRIAGEYDATERTIHMDVANHDGAAPSLHGHSIGRWDGGTLIVDTAAFAEHRTGNALGVPSGRQKHLIERLTLGGDGTNLTYQFELTDPEFLAAPVKGEVQWVHRADTGFERHECNLDNARRFAERPAQTTDDRPK